MGPAREAERQRAGRRENLCTEKQDEAAATNYWKRYIRDQLDSANMALTKAIAQAIVDENGSAIRPISISER